MITYRNKIDIVPGARAVEIYLNQYDAGARLVFDLYARVGELLLETGTTAAVRGTKPDGNGFSANAELDIEAKTVTVVVDPQMTVVAGRGTYELTLYNGTDELNTNNFVINVERAALDKDTPTSRSQTRELVEIEDNAEEIIGAAARAAATEANIERLAAQVSGDASSAVAIANQAIATATNADNTATEAANRMDATGRAVQVVQLALEGKVDGAYTEDGYLYLTSNNEVVAGPIGPFAGGGGGGGGGGNNAVMAVTNTTGWLSTTISEGAECLVSLSWSSLEDEMPTGDGTARIMVNNVQKAALNVRQGAVRIDVSEYCGVGANVVKITVSDVYGNSRTINFSVQVVSISISSTFDSSTPYTGVILFPYTPVGNIQKTVRFKLDGTEIDTVVTSVSGRQMSYTLAQQAHGAHVFEVYFDCEINGQTVESNHLRYEIISIEAGETAPIIVSDFRMTTAPQYTTLNIPYTVYDPEGLTAPVTIRVNGGTVASLTVDRTQQVFAYRADTVGILTVSIICGTVSKSVTVTITESDVQVEAETDQLKLFLTSEGRSNNEAHPEVWQDVDNNISATLTGFNFASDGWVQDGDGITVLRVSGDARVAIPYQPFASDFRSTGKTIEVEFATRDVLNYDAAILTCMNGGRGISLTAQLARLASEQSEISMQYKENEHVRIAFVVEKSSQNRLIYIYVNGIMSGAVQYPELDDFSQQSPVGISIGSNSCTMDIYCIRVYDNNLERGQILNNWIADTRNVTDMLARFRRNNILDQYGNVVIAKLPQNLPYMIVECAELPQYKGDKKTCSVTYVDPVTPAKSFTAENVQIDVQGTSSQYYPRKNYKMKYKSGFTLANGTQAAKYALRNGQIAVSTFCMKADVASSEGANNVELVRLYDEACPYKTPAQENDEAVRQGIDGFPIVMFWHDTEHDATSFIGKYNFNNDKSTEKTFGFVSGDESWEVRNNTSDRVLFKSDDFSDEGWLSDFEARYPDTDPAYDDPTQLAEFASFVKSTDTAAATGDALLEPYTDVDGNVHTVDDAAYRLAKFRTEIGDYVEVESMLFYYLFTEEFLMVDSRAKNMFPSFIGAEVAQL